MTWALVLLIVAFFAAFLACLMREQFHMRNHYGSIKKLERRMEELERNVKDLEERREETEAVQESAAKEMARFNQGIANILSFDGRR